MRSIVNIISGPPCERKRAARWTPLLCALAALLLAGCADTGIRNTSRTFSTVVVDAGHGGQDAGTRSSRLILEKDAALDIALRLDSKLRAAGFSTVVTRKADYFIPLDTRAAISNRTRNAIFVSVHLNEARPKPYIYGAETYYFSAPSAELAQRIVSRVGSLPGTTSRGIHTARFRVLRKNLNPAVLVECGYLSNKSEAARFASPGYRDQVAGAIAAAIVEQRRR